MAILNIEATNTETTVTLGDHSITIPNDYSVMHVATMLEMLTDKYTQSRDTRLKLMQVAMGEPPIGMQR
jgi:hypothetical protein